MRSLWLLGLTCVVAAAGCGGSTTSPTGESEAGSPGEPPFEEVSADVGLEFVHFNGMSGELYFLEIFGPGVALLDYDGDVLRVETNVGEGMKGLRLGSLRVDRGSYRASPVNLREIMFGLD